MSCGWGLADCVTGAAGAVVTVFGQLPPARIQGQDGTPLHSWWVLLLPFPGHEDLYRCYDFSQPWKATVSKHLIAIPPDVYVYPHLPISARTNATCCYSAIVDDGTSSEFHVSAGNSTAQHCAVVVETSASPVEWTCPEDVSVSNALLWPDNHKRSFAAADVGPIHTLSLSGQSAVTLCGWIESTSVTS